jgi:hypothetical protein
MYLEHYVKDEDRNAVTIIKKSLGVSGAVIINHNNLVIPVKICHS